MISVTDNFKNTVKGDVKQYVAYLTDGEDEITHADDLKGLKVWANGGLCRTVMRQAEASFWGTHDYLDSYVNLGIGVLLPEVNDLGEVTLSIDDPCEVGLVEHGLRTGDKVQLTTTGDLPTGLAESTFYYVVNILDEEDVIEPDIFNLASSYANAISGVLIETTGSQSGTHNLMLHTGNFSSTDETIDYGAFKVVEVEENKANDQRVLKMYDRMYESLQEYVPVDLEFPVTVKVFLEDICTTLGWTLGTTSFVHDGLEMDRDLFMGIGLTYRDVLEDIAEISGTIMMFSDDELVLRSVDTTTSLETLTTSDVSTLTLEPEWGELNSVVFSRMPQEDNIVEKDDESIAIYGVNELKIENNLIVDGDRETYITDTFNALNGIKYYPFETKTVGLGYLEVGDVIKVTDKTPTEHTVLITDVEFSLTGGLNEVIKGQSPDKTTTNYEVAGIIGKRIKNTEIIVDKQAGEITSLVNDTTQIKQTAEAISLTAQTALSNSETNADNIGTLQSDVTTLEARADGLDIAVTQTGGSNLLKNSSGLKGSLEEWVEEGEFGGVVIEDFTERTETVVGLDNFNDNTFDTTKWWRTNETNVLELNEQLEITTDTTSGYFTSRWIDRVDISDGYVSVELISTTDINKDYYEGYPLELNFDADNRLMVMLGYGGIICIRKQGGSNTEIYNDTYVAETHKFLRIRGSGTTVYFEYSTDGETWSEFGNTTVTFDITSVQPLIMAGHWDTEVAVSKLVVDNFQVVESGTSNLPEGWVAWGGDETGMVLDGYWQLTTSDSGYQTKGGYRAEKIDLNHRAISCKIYDVDTDTGYANLELVFFDGGYPVVHSLNIGVKDDTITSGMNIGAGWDTVGYTARTAEDYVRIRLESGMAYMEMSDDGEDWTTFAQTIFNVDVSECVVRLWLQDTDYAGVAKFDDLTLWGFADAFNRGTVVQSTEVAMNTESGSGIYILGQYIQQVVPTIIGETYTFFTRFKKAGTVYVDITGQTQQELTITDYVDEEWGLYKYQFVATDENTTVKIDATAVDSAALVCDMVLKIGDVTGWVQAPNEVYGSNFRFDKDGFSITSQTDNFKSVLDNTKLAVYDTSSGGNRAVMVVSKDSGKISSLIAQETLSVQRYENPASRVRFIPTATGCMVVVND